MNKEAEELLKAMQELIEFQRAFHDKLDRALLKISIALTKHIK